MGILLAFGSLGSQLAALLALEALPDKGHLVLHRERLFVVGDDTELFSQFNPGEDHGVKSQLS